MKVLGINAVFHDPAAAVLVDGALVAAAEEERFSRRKHGKTPVPFATWELPEAAARWCLAEAGLAPEDLDAVAYSYDPALAPPLGADITAGEWEGLRTLYAERAGLFLASALPGFDPGRLHYVRHHMAHAASAYLMAPLEVSSVMVLDGRGESTSYLAGHAEQGHLEILATQALPHSLGLLYEELTQHLGFRRSSDEYKVMALAAYGRPTYLPEFRSAVRTTPEGGFTVEPIDWGTIVKARRPERAGEEGNEASADKSVVEERFVEVPLAEEHADLACSVQTRLEEVLLELARWLHGQTGDRALTLAGGVGLNCVANSRLWREGPFEKIWVQPAAGDAGTALGAAAYIAQSLGDTVSPMETAALGRCWSPAELRRWLDTAHVGFEEPGDLPAAVADILAGDGIVAWFQGRSEWGPRALGHRSLLANASRPGNLERLNDIKGREQFRPVAPMVLEERAAGIFDGPIPSPHMLFTHRIRPGWADRIPAVAHVDGTARIQTVAAAQEPLLAALLEAVEARTGVPVLVNTSLNTAGRPMVDDPRDALECFGSSPIDALVLGPFLIRRPWTR